MQILARKPLSVRFRISICAEIVSFVALDVSKNVVYNFTCPAELQFDNNFTQKRSKSVCTKCCLFFLKLIILSCACDQSS